MRKPEQNIPTTVLYVERDVLIRHAVAEYLRGCGFRIIEAVHSDEAISIIDNLRISVDVLLVNVRAEGSMNGFTLAQYAKTVRENVQTVTVGTPQRVAAAAGELCEQGPEATRTYDPQWLHDEIRRALAARGK